MKIEHKSKKTFYEQIVDQIIEYISLGVYMPSDKLPSVRDLANQLHVNPNTIQKAYKELENKGFIYSITGKGSYVKELNKHSDNVIMNLLKKTIHSLVSQSFYVGVDEVLLSSMIHEEFERESANYDRNKEIIQENQ